MISIGILAVICIDGAPARIAAEQERRRAGSRPDGPARAGRR